jgi:hypothetical protein
VTFRFEGLEIFQAAIDFSARVHETVRSFPRKNSHIASAPCCPSRERRNISDQHTFLLSDPQLSLSFA